MNRLPNSPSKLIRLALDDMRKVERSKDYKIDLSIWHDGTEGDGNGQCVVCFAGSVMSKSLHVSKTKDVGPEELGGDIRDKLYALDSFRCGWIRDGLEEMSRKDLGNMLPFNTLVPDYKDDRAGFKRAMSEMADIIETAERKLASNKRAEARKEKLAARIAAATQTVTEVGKKLSGPINKKKQVINEATGKEQTLRG